MDEIQMPHDLASSGGGRGHQIVVFAQARGRAVIHDKAVFAQHQAIADLSHGQSRKGAGIDEVKKAGGISALQVNFAKG